MQFGRRRFRVEKKPRHLSPIEKVVYAFAIVVSLALSLALLLTIISPYISPIDGGILPILGLIAPITYMVNVVSVLIWIIYWRWRIATPIIIVVILGSLYSSLFLKVPIKKEYDNKSYRGMVKVLSYNIRSFHNDSWESSERGVARYVDSLKPDLICFQEFGGSDNNLFERSAPNIAKYHKAESEALRIYSRYPILRSHSISLDNETNGSEEVEIEEEKRGEKEEEEDIVSTGAVLVIDIVVREDTIRVFNNHLQSTAITAHDNRYLTSRMIVRDTNRNRNVAKIISRYRSSCIERARQVDIVSKQIEESPYPTIVCGDFNDPPASYTYFTMSKGMRDAFQRCGKDYSYTYRGFFNLLRIDYILCSDEITPHSYKADSKATFSDHLPIYSHLEIKRRE